MAAVAAGRHGPGEPSRSRWHWAEGPVCCIPQRHGRCVWSVAAIALSALPTLRTEIGRPAAARLATDSDRPVLRAKAR